MEAALLFKLFDTLPATTRLSLFARLLAAAAPAAAVDIAAEIKAEACSWAQIQADMAAAAAEERFHAQKAKADAKAEAEAKRRAKVLAKIRPHTNALEALRAALVAHAAEARELAGASQLMRGPKDGKDEWYKQAFNENLEKARRNVSAYAERAGEQARAAAAALEHLGDAVDPDAVRREARAACEALDVDVIMKDLRDYAYADAYYADAYADADADYAYAGYNDSHRLADQLRASISDCTSLQDVARRQAAAREALK